MSRDSVLDVACYRKYVECGPLNAVCNCETNENYKCIKAGTCECNSMMHMFPKTYKVTRKVHEKAYTTVCELDLFPVPADGPVNHVTPVTSDPTNDHGIIENYYQLLKRVIENSYNTRYEC